MRWVGLISAASVVVVACGTDYQTADSSVSSPDAGADGSASSSTASSSSSGGADGADGGTPSGEVQAGAITEEACADRIADPDTGVFVRADTGADSDTCGAIDVPCKTITQALVRAATLVRANIYVGAGLYTESLSLAANVSVEGGWTVDGTSWKPDCSANNATTVKIQGADDVTVQAKAASAGIGFLTISSLGSAAPGETLYGIAAIDGANLVVNDVILTVENGGAGLVGTSATAPAAAPASCAAGDGGEPTETSAPGSPGAAGSFAASGFTSGVGGQAPVGDSGHNGTAAPTPSAVTYEICSPSCVPTQESITPKTGTNGCGGPGGIGGLGGGGGGSSVGIFAANATVTLIGSTIVVGNGGVGGAGGPGSAGATGSAGAAGTSQPYVRALGGCQQEGNESAPESVGATPEITPGVCMTGTETVLAGGAAGGSGTNGASGGQGGGGAGGWSVGLATFGTGKIESSTDSTITVGAAGKGGAPNGIDGVAAAHVP